jgi:hypothetical protein
MKKLITLLAFPMLVLAQTQEQNYVKTTVYRDSLTTGSPVNSITYIDGLGRPKQQIAGKQSNAGKDIVTEIRYDAYGRQVKEYLPFLSTQDNLAYLTGSIPNDIKPQYLARYNDSIAYSEKLFEASPLNRMLKQAAPGGSWKMGSGHEVKFDFQTNAAGEVRVFEVDGSQALINAGTNYVEHTLYKTITKDENWISGHNNTTEEFKDKEGHVILKRTYSDYIVNGSITLQRWPTTPIMCMTILGI